MSKKDTRTIAYIFNEMDPSEEVEFLRELESNSNLLIEVETLRNINGQLDQLPEVNPPDHIVKSVQDFAQKNKKATLLQSSPSVYIAVAAMVVLGLTTGIFLLDDQTSQNSNTTQEAAISGSTNFSQSPANTQESPAREVTPWIDRNEILHFQSRNQYGNVANFDSMRSNSQQKLIRVTDPVHTRIYQGHLHLTGNRR